MYFIEEISTPEYQRILHEKMERIEQDSGKTDWQVLPLPIGIREELSQSRMKLLWNLGFK